MSGYNPFTGKPFANYPSRTVSQFSEREPVVHIPNHNTGTWHSNDGSGWVDTKRMFNKPNGGGSRRRTVHRKRKSHRKSKSKRVHHTRRKQSRRHRHSRRRHH